MYIIYKKNYCLNLRHTITSSSLCLQNKAQVPWTFYFNFSPALCWIWSYIKSLHYYSNISGLLCARSFWSSKILHFVAFLHFLSFVLLHRPSIWCIFACHFSVWTVTLFFPFTPFQNCFPHISFWNCRCADVLFLWRHYHFWLANPPKDLGISGIPSPVLPMSVFRKHLPYLPTFFTPTLAEIPSLTPYAVITSFRPAYQMLPLKNLNYFPSPCRLVKTNIAV